MKNQMNTLAKEAVEEAEFWQNRANELMAPEEKEIREQMKRLLDDPLGKVVLTRMIDQSFRSRNPARVADQINSVLTEYGVPDFFSIGDKLLVQVFRGLGRHVPEISVPRVIEKMRHDSRRVIIPGESEALHRHLRKRRAQGVRMNLNHLGEAVLGEAEALRRLRMYMQDLGDPDIECISVKISTLYSQIRALAFEETVAVLKERLAQLLQAAHEHFFIRSDGSRVRKFVNLDMEAYSDLAITAAVFVRTLEHEAFREHSAGIALQAYLPDSFSLQQELTAWARKRTAAGGSPVKIRLVKGANLEMEKVEAALRGWPLAPYDNKADVDANYKQMVEFGLQPDNAKSVHLGIASHNLFDLAYAWRLVRENSLEEFCTFEMLEGMANHVSRAVQETVHDMLRYAPVADRSGFINAIAYLIRRLDENSGEQNFLRHAAGLQTDSAEWNFLREQFLEALANKDRPRRTPHRVQNRLTETFDRPLGPLHSGEFENEPDTDWSLAPNRQWAQAVRMKWRPEADRKPPQIPLVIGGREIFADRPERDCLDLSRLPETIRTARCALAGQTDVLQAVAVAKSDPDGWRKMDARERHRILSRVAAELRRARGDLIGAAAAGTGKVFTESDPEVSEAVDFTEFYAFAAGMFHTMPNLECRPKGVGVVISPWNFPISIPCGGIMAALAAGNTVIFKPASAAIPVGWELCRAIWQAGVSRNTLQFLPFAGSDTGAVLTGHPDVDFVIFTGGTETARAILRKCPGLFLAAETGGKNATIVTAMADREQAIQNVIHSAFSNSGQKCSATSLLILEEEVYRDRSFKRQLVDAAESLAVGSAWEFASRMGPLIQPPAGDLQRALTQLEPGESWALKPRNLARNPHLWTPGIKWGVSAGSITHMTEFFGPLLAVMAARNLDHAIRLVNQTGYGLTSAIETLDKREQQRWQNGVKAGNLYINRGTTGAIVLRQPFGGMNKSALGAGIKVGYFNYVAQFMHIAEKSLPPAGAIAKDHPLLRLVREWMLKTDAGEFAPIRSDIVKTVRAVRSYLYRYEQEFCREKDYFHLRGQDNLIRYLPVGRVLIRLHPDDTLFDGLARIAAARISGCRPVVSIPPDLNNALVEFLHAPDGQAFAGSTPLVRQSEAEFIAALPEFNRLRYAAPDRVPAAVLAEAARLGLYIARMPVLAEGRIELLQYFIEQSICNNYHRYGNLGERGLKENEEPISFQR